MGRLEPDTLVDLLLGESPREAALRTLEWIRSSTQARSVSLWLVVGEKTSLLLGVALDQESIGRMEEAVAEGRSSLEDGNPFRSGGCLLIPIEIDGVERLVLYLDGAGPDGRDHSLVTSYARVALRALRHSGAGTPRLAREARREELVALLRLHEWNIARVARARNVTRKTIYEWLRKLKIHRERIQKA
jgi:DNA-binding NtrC family response regulator